MTSTGDESNREVAVAKFRYRHEAELAAGFLRDGGIPYRLQIDDAGGIDFGTTFSRPPVLWVRAADLADARELLGLEGDVGSDGHEGEVR